jgi:hypothetical protein
LSLAAAVEAVFISATLESRGLARVKDCQALWTGVAQLFGELVQVWTDLDSDDPSINWLRARLEHFRTRAQDQTELYKVSEKERQRHAKNRGSAIESFGVRNGSEAAGYSSEGRQGHVYSYSLPKATRC